MCDDEVASQNDMVIGNRVVVTYSPIIDKGNIINNNIKKNQMDSVT